MSNSATETVHYKEYLAPTPWLYLVLLLIAPAVALLFMPLNLTLGVVLAPICYVIAVAMLLSSTPRIMLLGDTFYAGHASIPVRFLGTVEVLDSDELALAIGIKSDARAYLLIRSWIHSGIKVHNTDPTDPAPFWIITSRNPEQLRKALEAAKAQAALKISKH